MLVFTVDNAYRSIRIFKFDNVITNVVCRTRKLNSQGFIHPLLEVCAANLVFANPNILGEKIYQSVDIPHIQC